MNITSHGIIRSKAYINLDETSAFNETDTDTRIMKKSIVEEMHNFPEQFNNHSISYSCIIQHRTFSTHIPFNH